MDEVKRVIACKDPFIERIRAYAPIEGEDHDSQVILNFNDVQIKSFKNSSSRLEACELGVLMYGRNLQT